MALRAERSRYRHHPQRRLDKVQSPRDLPRHCAFIICSFPHLPLLLPLCTTLLQILTAAVHRFQAAQRRPRPRELWTRQRVLQSQRQQARRHGRLVRLCVHVLSVLWIIPPDIQHPRHVRLQRPVQGLHVGYLPRRPLAPHQALGGGGGDRFRLGERRVRGAQRHGGICQVVTRAHLGQYALLFILRDCHSPSTDQDPSLLTPNAARCVSSTTALSTCLGPSLIYFPRCEPKSTSAHLHPSILIHRQGSSIHFFQLSVNAISSAPSSCLSANTTLTAGRAPRRQLTTR